jgi:hypothetical protein
MHKLQRTLTSDHRASLFFRNPADVALAYDKQAAKMETELSLPVKKNPISAELKTAIEAYLRADGNQAVPQIDSIEEFRRCDAYGVVFRCGDYVKGKYQTK